MVGCSWPRPDWMQQAVICDSARAAASSAGSAAHLVPPTGARSAAGCQEDAQRRHGLLLFFTANATSRPPCKPACPAVPFPVSINALATNANRCLQLRCARRFPRAASKSKCMPPSAAQLGPASLRPPHCAAPRAARVISTMTSFTDLRSSAGLHRVQRECGLGSSTLKQWGFKQPQQCRASTNQQPAPLPLSLRRAVLPPQPVCPPACCGLGHSSSCEAIPVYSNFITGPRPHLTNGRRTLKLGPPSSVATCGARAGGGGGGILPLCSALEWLL